MTDVIDSLLNLLQEQINAYRAGEQNVKQYGIELRKTRKRYEKTYREAIKLKRKAISSKSKPSERQPRKKKDG